MSLRLIARDLYHLQQEVDRLQKDLDQSDAGGREEIIRRLAQKIGERDQMKKILDGRLDR